MNFRQVEAFRAVMEAGSATAAGKLLFVTQPAISRLIAEMERQSNLTLFIRRPNRLEPTSEAKALYKDVDRAFIGLEEIQRSADAIANQQMGSLRIVAVPICVDSFLPGLIAHFLQLHPNVSIELESAPHIQALDLVRTQRLDLGIVSLNPHEDIELQVQGLCRQRAVCVLPVNHPLCNKQVIHVRDLENEAMISISRGSPFRARLEEVYAREGFKGHSIIETRTQKTIYELVKIGAGIAILDPLITNKNDTSVVVKPFFPELNWEYSLIQSASASSSLIIRSFIELLLQYFSTIPTSQDVMTPRTKR